MQRDLASRASESHLDNLFIAAAQLSDEDVLSLADRLHDLLRSRRGARGATHRYAVVRCGEEWRVVCRGGRIGHFKTVDEALAFCRRLVVEAAASGGEIEFLVQNEYGELLNMNGRHKERRSFQEPTEAVGAARAG